MTEQAASTEKSAPALGISMSVNLSAQHAITLQTYVDSEAPVEVAHGMADKLASVADRLIARYRLVDLKKNLQVHETMVRRATQDLNDLDERARLQHSVSGKAGALKLNANQQADRDNTKKSIARFEEEIVKIKLEIANAEKEAK